MATALCSGSRNAYRVLDMQGVRGAMDETADCSCFAFCSWLALAVTGRQWADGCCHDKDAKHMPPTFKEKHFEASQSETETRTEAESETRDLKRT